MNKYSHIQGGNMKKIVELKKVSKVYKTGEKEFKALDNIDLSIEKGEFVVVLGPSGAGKSTLLNLIGGMDTPTSGNIIIDGENICKTKYMVGNYRNNFRITNWIFYVKLYI